MAAQAVRVTGYVCLAAALAAGGTTEARAQLLSCGTASTSVSIRQAPNYAQYVEVNALTTRSFTSCPISLQTEAWVEGLGGAVIGTGVYTAEARFGRPVPYFGTWRATAKHWAIWTGVGWVYLGQTWAATSVVPPPSPPPPGVCLLTASDCPEGTVWAPAICNCKTSSPILLDTLGNGYALTDSASGVPFDLNANGQAERIAWTAPDSDDAWLVFDRNANGLVDDGTELFGDATPAYPGGVDPPADNGFVALKMLEGPGYGTSRPDGVIDAADAAFGHLLLWFDRNHDGVSQPGELVPPGEVGLLALGTDSTESRHRDRHGNLFALKGVSTWRRADGRLENRSLFDVYLTVEGMPKAKGHVAEPEGPPGSQARP